MKFEGKKNVEAEERLGGCLYIANLQFAIRGGL